MISIVFEHAFIDKGVNATLPVSLFGYIFKQQLYCYATGMQLYVVSFQRNSVKQLSNKQNWKLLRIKTHTIYTHQTTICVFVLCFLLYYIILSNNLNNIHITMTMTRVASIFIYPKT